jgi:hypothetical protein
LRQHLIYRAGHQRERRADLMNNIGKEAKFGLMQFFLFFIFQVLDLQVMLQLHPFFIDP